MPDDTSNPLYPYPTLGKLWREQEQERRADAAARYVEKFSGLFMDIELALIGLDILAQWDSAAREAHTILSAALTDARSTIAGSAE